MALFISRSRELRAATELNADPAKRNGHPTLFARLGQLLKQAPPPLTEVTIRYFSGEGKVTGTETLKFQKAQIRTLPDCEFPVTFRVPTENVGGDLT